VADDSSQPNVDNQTLTPPAYLLANGGEQATKKATGENTPMAIIR
jgi:hypothetical protein